MNSRNLYIFYSRFLFKMRGGGHRPNGQANFCAVLLFFAAMRRLPGAFLPVAPARKCPARFSFWVKYAIL